MRERYSGKGFDGLFQQTYKFPTTALNRRGRLIETNPISATFALISKALKRACVYGRQSTFAPWKLADLLCASFISFLYKKKNPIIRHTIFFVEAYTDLLKRNDQSNLALRISQDLIPGSDADPAR